VQREKRRPSSETKSSGFLRTEKGKICEPTTKVHSGKTDLGASKFTTGQTSAKGTVGEKRGKMCQKGGGSQAKGGTLSTRETKGACKKKRRIIKSELLTTGKPKENDQQNTKKEKGTIRTEGQGDTGPSTPKDSPSEGGEEERGRSAWENNQGRVTKLVMDDCF